MTYDAFDGDGSDVAIPELDEEVAERQDALGEPEGELGTDDILKKSNDRRLLTKSDPWNGPAPKQKAKPEDTGTGQEEDGAAEEKPEDKPAPVIKGKTLAFKAGDKTLEVPETATVQVKVDGKLVDVPVTELSTHYSGKVAWDKRFSELTNERRAFAAEKQSFNSTREKSQQLLNDFHKNIAAGDTFSAIASLVTVSGLDGKLDPRKFVSELRTALMQQASQLANLTPEERAQLEAKEEYEYTKKQLSQLREQREREQNEYSTQQSFAKKLVEHQLQVEDLHRSYDYLTAEGSKHGIDVSKYGPEELLQYTLTVREFQTAIEAIRDVSPELAENRQYQEEAVRLLRAYPGTTKAELAEVLREAIGEKRSESVSKKVAKAPTPTPAIAKARAKANPGTSKEADLFARITRKSDIW